MRCHDVEKNLSAHLDGELEAEQSQRIAAHLEGCASCRGQAQAFGLLDDAIGAALPQPEPSAGFDAAFRGKLEAARLDQARASQAVSRKRRWFSWPLFAGAAATVAATVLAVVLIGKEPTTQPLPRHRTLASAQPVSDLDLAQNLDLLKNYPVVEKLDTLEDFDAIAGLDGLEEALR
jgi:anti-sigma factor RsiW